MGQTRLGGSFVICVFQLILQQIDLPLGGRRRGFSPSSSFSFSITHQRVILYLHSTSLLFQLLFYCCDLMNMAQSSYIVCSLALLYSALSLSQNKINRALILIWGSKHLLCFHTMLSFQGRLGLEGLFDIRVLQLIHQWIDFSLEDRGEVFAEYFGFFFDNTFWFCLVFSSLFPTL